MNQLPGLTNSGAASLLDFTEDYRAAASVAKLPLESADVDALVARAKALASARHLLLPDADVLLQRCVTALLAGHLILQGPPGTGKTTLAYVLAEAFESSAHLETATADWSTYDVIGGLHPSAANFAETLVPWLGHVSRAAVQCAGVIARHADDPATEPAQAHWLIIDEFSRAEIDKAIGPLYTVLSGGGVDEPLSLWFETKPERQVVYLPRRFRILGTMNTVDTNYVYTFSQGLSRRFQFVYVGVPARSQIPAELASASASAADWYANSYGGQGWSPDTFIKDPRVDEATKLLGSFLSAVRYDDPATNLVGWPLGTAQVADVYRHLTLWLPASSPENDALLPALDLALADRVIPQAGNLLKVQLDAAETWLQKQQLPRALAALQHLRSAASTGY
jgi:MoxR-like ATPase